MTRSGWRDDFDTKASGIEPLVQGRRYEVP